MEVGVGGVETAVGVGGVDTGVGAGVAAVVEVLRVRLGHGGGHEAKLQDMSSIEVDKLQVKMANRSTYEEESLHGVADWMTVSCRTEDSFGVLS